MSKKLDFGADARAELLKGVEKLNSAVAATLGPNGRNVVIEKGHGTYHSTKDGVTVAKQVVLKDTLQNAGAQMVKEVASQVNDEAGDGTTTATVLASSILKNGYKTMTDGSNPTELKRGMDKAVKEVISRLKNLSRDVSSADEIEQVGTISANNDKKVGALIAEAMDAVGQEGVITAEESQTAEDSLEVVEGLQFDKGYISPYFINNQKEMIAQLESPNILLYDGKISSLKPIVKILEHCIAQDKPLFILAEDVDGEALAGLIVNSARGTLKVVAAKAPGFGEKRSAYLEDIAILTGGTVVSTKRGMKLEKVTGEEFGTARLITCNSKVTTIVDGGGSTEAIEARGEEIKTLIDSSDSAYETEALQERLGKLSGGVAIIKVGAESELELQEKKDRVEDALAATRAAVDEGIVIGGGMALRRISKDITRELDMNTNTLEHIKLDNKDQKLGFEIILESCKAPFNTIVENAGKNAEVIWSVVAPCSDEIGYDVREGDTFNMFEAGIVDPTRVTRTALEKASSVAGTMLITECVITDIPEEEKNENPAGGFGMMQ